MLKLGSLKLKAGVPHVAVPFSGAMPAFAGSIKPGFDIAEARIDLFGSFDAADVLKKLTSFKGMPSIATIRTKAEGGGWTGTEKARQNLFNAVLPHTDAVDIELSSAATLGTIAPIAKKQGKLVIVSYHNFRTTPDLAALNKIVSKAEASGADIVKIATHIKNDAHIVTLASLLLRHAKKNLIVIGMGDKGAVTRLLFPHLGSLITFASNGAKATAPGQIPVKRMQKLLRKIYL